MLQVLPRLSSESVDQRLNELRNIYDEAKAKNSLPETGDEVNNHVHSVYSFSPYNPSQIAYMAWQSGLKAVGIMDHDSFSGASEMVEACKILGLGSTCGMELRVNTDGTTFAGRSMNNPDSKGIIYMAIHGISLKNIDAVSSFLKPIQRARNERNRRQVEVLNALLSESSDLDAIEFQRDVYNSSMASLGGSITERHILAALGQKIIDQKGKGLGCISFLKNSLGIEINAIIKERLIDTDNPHYIYDLLGVLKSQFLPRFFIQPNREECIPVQKAVDFAKSIGAIPAYAYLGDVGESPTGDKKAEKFEDSFLDELMEELSSIGFLAVTYMPPRNTLEQLQRLMKLCDHHGFMQISGVDINSSRQQFNCPEILLPQFSHLNESTWALIAHEKLNNMYPEAGLFGSKSFAVHQNLAERITSYSVLGKKMNLHTLEIQI